VIGYYLKQKPKQLHIHVHRESSGPPHLQVLQGYLQNLQQFIREDDNNWLANNGTTRLTFGYGYKGSNISPHDLGKDSKVDVYYSISLICGLTLYHHSGDTFVPVQFTKLDTNAKPFPVYNPRPAYNWPFQNDLEITQKVMVHDTDLVASVWSALCISPKELVWFQPEKATIAILPGLFYPTPETLVKTI